MKVFYTAGDDTGVTGDGATSADDGGDATAGPVGLYSAVHFHSIIKHNHEKHCRLGTVCQKIPLVITC